MSKFHSIHLNWQGPFSLGSSAGRSRFDPPSSPGVYLWTVAPNEGQRISYIGQAANINERMYQHIFWTLGGAYCLYDRQHLVEGNPPVPVYEPGLPNLISTFLNDFNRFSAIAIENAIGYNFFWAILDTDTSIRRAVESALITRAREREEPIQNMRLSRNSANSPHVVITSLFSDGVKVEALSGEIEYGVSE
jgi:hypothetical protein